MTNQNGPVSSNQVNRQFLFDTPILLPAQPAAPVQKKASLGVLGTVVIASLVSGVVGGVIGVGGYMLSTAPAAVVVNNTDSVNWVTGASSKALPSVVTISVSSANEGGSGSGVFLTADGYILTNAHVVTLSGASANPKVTVKTLDGKIYPADIVGTDPNNDLAVIKISAAGAFTPIDWADSSKVNVGDSVVALGAPLGLENSVTTGVISALNRTIQVASSDTSEDGSSLQWWNGTGAAPVSLRVLQTDAAINPGNSGGALVNAQGQLIGINVAIATAGATTSSSQSGSIGVGFAITSNIAKRIASELMKDGKASHALLGAMVGNAGQETDGFSSGALVGELTPGGPGEKAGLKVGDIVTSFNGYKIDTAADLTAAVRAEPAGATATLEVTRGTENITITVVLGDLGDLK
ncbi:MAG: S1C family serine protease [Rhodoluna sp.]